MNIKKVVRPMVEKNLPRFKQWIKEFGPDLVRGCLASKDGKYKTAKLTVANLNKKDKAQLIQMLNL